MSDLAEQLDAARSAARRAAGVIRPQFGRRDILDYKGHNDVQLRADVVAQRTIVAELRAWFPEYGYVTEEDGGCRHWPDAEYVWVVDPIDGSNNFGYGIAHFAISITLVHVRTVVLALVFEPLAEREFFATAAQRWTPAVRGSVPLARSTVSVVTNYSREAGAWSEQAIGVLSRSCKRVLNLWAPSLDLALLADGSIDAVVCRHGSTLDVCGGLFLVESSGGVVWGWDGRPLRLDPADTAGHVSFIAARSAEIAGLLREVVPTPRP